MFTHTSVKSLSVGTNDTWAKCLAGSAAEPPALGDCCFTLSLQWGVLKHIRKTRAPQLTQPDSINIHKRVWPSLVEAALNFSTEWAVCVYICVLLTAFVLGRHLSWTLAVKYSNIRHRPSSLLTWDKHKNISDLAKSSGGKENVVNEKEMCQAASQHKAGCHFKLSAPWKLQLSDGNKQLGGKV